jgi:hypothetical protein
LQPEAENDPEGREKMTAGTVKTAMLLMLSLSVMFGAVRSARADFYKYKDSRGTVCITNKLESVPARYRATMTVTREERLPPKDSAERKEAEQASPPATEAATQQAGQEAAAPGQPTGRFGRLAARFPWLKPLAVLCGITAAFIGVTRIAAMLPSPQLAKLIYLAFFLGVFGFAYVSYARHLATSYLAIKEKMLVMFKKANEREGLRPGTGDKAGRQIEPEPSPALAGKGRGTE